MKKFICLAVFAIVSLSGYAQFILTPSAGLMTEDGPYTIHRNGTEAENYEAAKKAVLSAIPDAKIGDLEYEKSFNASATLKDRRRLPGAMVSNDLSWEYTLEVDCADGKVLVSFKNIGPLKVIRKGEVFVNIYPSTGTNSMLTQVAGVVHVFNSKGTVAKGGLKKMKELFEDYANTIAKNIESNLK